MIISARQRVANNRGMKAGGISAASSASSWRNMSANAQKALWHQQPRKAWPAIENGGKSQKTVEATRLASARNEIEENI